MKASRILRSFLPTILLGGLALCLTGCSLIDPCRSGKRVKPKAFNVTVNLDSSLQQAGVVVDLIAVNETSLPRLENYSLSKYWKEGDPARNDADQRGDKVTMSFISGQALTNSLGKVDPKWNRWLAQGATHLLVLADLPGVQGDKPGTQDPRRQILPLDPCHWPKRTATLAVHVQRSGITVLTPLRPRK